MAKGFKDLEATPEARALDHAEWLGLLLDHEMTLRRQKRFESRARTAKLRHAGQRRGRRLPRARGLDRTLFLKLAACDWIREQRNLLITGPCGVGKSWLACALGQKACREDLLRPLSPCPAPVRRPRRSPAVTAAMPRCCASSPASSC